MKRDFETVPWNSVSVQTHRNQDPKMDIRIKLSSRHSKAFWLEIPSLHFGNALVDGQETVFEKRVLIEIQFGRGKFGYCPNDWFLENVVKITLKRPEDNK